MIRPTSAREKRLAAFVAALCLLGAAWWLVDGYLTQRARLRAQIAAQSKQLRLARGLTDRLPFWQERDAWLQASQPRFTDGDAAGVQLLERVKQLAKRHTVVLENPALRAPESQPAYTSVAVEVDAKCGWESLVAFLHELQSPAEFIAVESANLKMDAADPAQMHGRFEIARWFAPQ